MSTMLSHTPRTRNSVPGITSAGAPLRIGAVALNVRDLEEMSRFYRQVIGLTSIEREAGIERLGVGETILLELRHDPSAPLADRRAAGLFHIAFLLPSRADLGQWLRQTAEQRIGLQGASDHGVSEAIYLGDPEGNGIEMYTDRPSADWTWNNGAIAMKTDHLDIDDLLLSATQARWERLPEGSIVGHVHLQVGAIAPAETFFGAVLGFDTTARVPGGSFFGSGRYHHHLAANTWNSRNAPVRNAPTTGLANVEIIAADPARLAAIATRAERGGLVVEGQPSRFSLRDPWGTSLTFLDAEASDTA
jgi:catechol 2,3-dioxygenase